MLKMKRLLQIAFITLLGFAGCDESDEPTAFTVSGFINYENAVIEQVTVSIDNNLDLTTSTDANGYFEISGVERGDYQLYVNKEISFISETTNETVISSSEKVVDISVNSDTEIESLRLPKAVFLYQARNITDTHADISWTPTDDTEFREYKLYRHSSSGLDESTGTLIHVSTSLNDTTFVDDDLNPLEQYYYRVFVMDDFGKIGGSNIMDLTTDNIQIIINGGFEDLSDNQPVDWNLTPNDFGNPNNYISVSDNDPYQGANSLEFHHAETSGCWEQWITQTIDKDMLVAGGNYKLTFAYKADFTASENMDLILRNSTIDMWLNVPIQFSDTQEWNELSYEFGLPDDIGNNDIKTDFHFCIQGVRTWWFDNIKLERVQ